MVDEQDVDLIDAMNQSSWQQPDDNRLAKAIHGQWLYVIYFVIGAISQYRKTTYVKEDHQQNLKVENDYNVGDYFHDNSNCGSHIINN